MIGSTFSVFPGDTLALDPSLALELDGTPIVAFHEYEDATTIEAHAMRWTGTEWRTLGTVLSAQPDPAIVEGAALTVDSEGRPVVAWAENSSTGPQDIYVRHYESDAWRPLGDALGARSGASPAGSAAIAAGASGAVYVGWYEISELTDVSDVFVYRWTGSTWQPLGGALGAVEGATRAFELNLFVSPRRATSSSSAGGRGPSGNRSADPSSSTPREAVPATPRSRSRPTARPSSRSPTTAPRPRSTCDAGRARSGPRSAPRAQASPGWTAPRVR